MEVVPWNNLRIGKKYFVVTTSCSEEKKPVVIRSLSFMNEGEAMIYALEGHLAYAVGGVFDAPGGPKNVFWTDPTENYSEPFAPAPASPAEPVPAPAEPAPAPAEPAPAPAEPVPAPAEPVAVRPPPPLDLSGIKMSEDDWAMAYGLRRCRLCGYNEGPEICPNNCYGQQPE